MFISGKLQPGNHKTVYFDNNATLLKIFPIIVNVWLSGRTTNENITLFLLFRIINIYGI